MFCLSLPPDVYREVHYLRYLNCSGVQDILCCVFGLFFFEYFLLINQNADRGQDPVERHNLIVFNKR
jgi:hypothetical protein